MLEELQHHKLKKSVIWSIWIIFFFAIISAGVFLAYYLMTNRLTKTQNVVGHQSGVSSIKPIPSFIQPVASDGENKYYPKVRSDIQSNIDDSRYNAIVQAIQKVSSSVVNISSIHIENVNPWFELYRIPGIPYRREYRALGSGIIFDKNGYILTNQHIVENADIIKVVLDDGREFEAELVGEDSLSDIAVLKINAPNLPQVEFGNSDDLLIGEWAIAIGNPFASYVKDPKPTVTVGVISATNRALQNRNRIYRNMIQTDASINPGNSGGALVNSSGQVIGVNTAIYSTSGGSQGIGFAIPINTAIKVINKLIKYGMVIEPWIGLEYQELSEEILQYMRLEDVTGVIVTEVEKDSPAWKAGIEKMDIIEAIDGRNIHAIDDATAIIRLLDVGQTAKFDIIRDGKQKSMDIYIQQMIDSYTAWGITVKPLTPKLAKEYRNKGVIISDIKKGSRLGRAGLKKGDLIYKIGNYRINSLSDFATLARRIRSNRQVSIYFERDNKEYILRIIL